MEDGRPRPSGDDLCLTGGTPVLHHSTQGRVYDGERQTMRTVAVIPARLASTRLARKALREIAGKPLVGWVYEAVRSSLRAR